MIYLLLIVYMIPKRHLESQDQNPKTQKRIKNEGNSPRYAYPAVAVAATAATT